MTTIKEIAKECNVSIATVSNVINNRPGVGEITREKVLEVIKKHQYTPNVAAKNLKIKNKRTIGIITEDLTVFNTSTIVDGINEYLEEHNYQFVLNNLRLYKKYGSNFLKANDYYNYVNEEFKMILSNQVEGIIYVGCHCRKLECIPDDFRVPIVTAYSYSDNQQVPAIIFNDEKAALDVVNTLIEKGHKKIGVICGNENSMHTKERLQGYRDALYNNEIVYNPDLLYYGDWEVESGYKGAEELMKKGVTAIFVMNDVMCAGAYNYFNEKSIKIGEDISIIGFDNREFSKFMNPKLSTVDLSLSQIGIKAAEVLLDNIKGNEVKEQNHIYKIQCKLIERSSS